MRVTKNENCGNSPKNAFIEELVIRLFKEENVDSSIEPGLPVIIAGSFTLNGTEDLVHNLIGSEPIEELIVYDAISHGKKGAVDLTIHTISHRIIEIGIFLEFKSLKADRIASMKFFVNQGSVHG